MGNLQVYSFSNHIMNNTIVIAGGSGFLGQLLAECFKENDIFILSRKKQISSERIKYVHWDGEHEGEWIQSLESCLALINMTGKSVNCRYTEKNKQEIFDSRTKSTNALGNAIIKLTNPPKVWINAGSATIYRHAEDRPMDEFTGEIGEGFSVDVCKVWEETFNAFKLPNTRQIILRTGIVLGEKGEVLPMFKRLVRFGLGGKMGNGNQYLNWIQDEDFCRVTEWCINNTKAEGIYNVTAPNAIKNKDFMKMIRKHLGMPFGLPSYKWMLEIGTRILGTESELILKSRWVYPARLLQEGFVFKNELPVL